MRWLFRLFLSLTFMVSFGHDAVHAGAVNNHHDDDLIASKYHHHQTALADRTRNAVQAKLANRHKQSDNHKIYIVEADEEIDESLTHSRLADHVDFFSAVSQLYIYGNYFRYVNKYLYTNVSPSISAIHKIYLSLKVFRI
ncbi:hypothetical protein LT679_16010 [Mucilaginibacter roseus]|uniref:Uncharacterized protein n=1 Tax=Mucilaginibacter roseus TaxID=1528868 RepID=A0ABS8U4U2_9SPHI|nr:hypothetical protein [Mucilaginibacter roseus]MCD8742116.1 hypothetical protein [Mucilaginibacter roseus]